MHKSAATFPTTLERWTAWTPFVILLYFAVQIAVRIWLSPNLEVDDAEMVDSIHWAWGYRNSHPPLFHWIVRLCHELLGSWPAVAAVSKFGLLAAAYLLVYDAARRATGSCLAGALAIASLLLMPTVAWKTQSKLTHSILCFAATAAAGHALIHIFKTGRAWTFAWLGLAIAMGLLAKYNFVLVLIGIAVGVAAIPAARRAFQRKAAWLAAAIPIALTWPHFAWVLAHPDLATERAHMLRTGGRMLGMSLNANSAADGIVSLAVCVAMAAGPALAVWLLVGRIFRADANGIRALDPAADPLRGVLGLVLLAELAAFALAVAVAGLSQVHERYLLALLPPLPIWLVLAFGPKLRPAGARAILALAVLTAVFITVVWPWSVRHSDHRLTFPYAAMAERLATTSPAPMAVLADRPDNAANIVLNMPTTAFFHPGDMPPRVLLVADDTGQLEPLATLLGSHYSPESEPVILSQPYLSGTGNMAKLTVQRWQRRGPAK